jgi:hypothetical protein
VVRRICRYEIKRKKRASEGQRIHGVGERRGKLSGERRQRRAKHVECAKKARWGKSNSIATVGKRGKETKGGQSHR